MTQNRSKMPVIAAHRGASSTHPENSLEAVKAALSIAESYPEFSFFIELDVRRTKDGIFVCHHNSRIWSKNHKSIKIENATWLELQAFASRENRKIITLEEAMSVVASFNRERSQSRPVGLALDVKPSFTEIFSFRKAGKMIRSAIKRKFFQRDSKPSAHLATGLADVFNKHAGKTLLRSPVLVFSSLGFVGKWHLTSFWKYLSPQTQKKFYRYNPEKSAPPISTPHMLYAHRRSRPFSGLYFKLCRIIKNFQCLEPETCHDVKPSFAVLDEKGDILRLTQMGATWITTNNPELAARVLREHYTENSLQSNASALKDRFGQPAQLSGYPVIGRKITLLRHIKKDREGKHVKPTGSIAVHVSEKISYSHYCRGKSSDIPCFRRSQSVKL